MYHEVKQVRSLIIQYSNDFVRHQLKCLSLSLNCLRSVGFICWGFFFFLLGFIFIIFFRYAYMSDDMIETKWEFE